MLFNSPDRPISERIVSEEHAPEVPEPDCDLLPGHAFEAQADPVLDVEQITEVEYTPEIKLPGEQIWAETDQDKKNFMVEKIVQIKRKMYGALAKAIFTTCVMSERKFTVSKNIYPHMKLYCVEKTKKPVSSGPRTKTKTMSQKNIVSFNETRQPSAPHSVPASAISALTTPLDPAIQAVSSTPQGLLVSALPPQSQEREMDQRQMLLENWEPGQEN